MGCGWGELNGSRPSNSLIRFQVQPRLAKPFNGTFQDVFEFYVVPDQYTAAAWKVWLELKAWVEEERHFKKANGG